MNGSKSSVENVMSEYKSLYAALEEIAEKWDSIHSESDSADLSSELQAVWKTYLRDFETGDMDVERAVEIADRMETIAMVQSIAEKIRSGIDISKEESAFYSDFKDTTITENEKVFYKAYKDALNDEAERRIGKSAAAYDVIIRAKRLCRLMSLKAPEMIINNEAYLLEQAMVIHSNSNEVKTIDSEDFE